MAKLGLALVLASLAGCDTGMNGVDSGPDRDDSGPRDAGRDAGTYDAGSDAGGGCGPVGMCQLTVATSCGVGMACLLQPSGGGGLTTMCFTAGTGTDGTTCNPTMAGECAEGFGCSPNEMVCRSWCCSATDCEAGQLCNQFAGANGAGLCVLPDVCTLVPPQTGCETDEECNVLDPATGALTCDPVGTANEGMPCMARNACVAGLTCVDDPGVCRSYCDMAATTPCTDTTFSCVPLNGAPDGVGVCVPAA